MFNYLQALAARQFNALDQRIRLVVIHPNYAQQYIVLGHVLNNVTAYVRFSGKELSLKDLEEHASYALHSQDAGLASVETLILDECDRATAEALDRFLTRLLEKMPQARIIIFSREIPRCILDNAVLRSQASFVPNDDSYMLWDYARLDADVKLLEVRSFGEGHALLNGHSIDNWDGILPRSLFFYLVDRGMATRNEIFETFWPNLPAREATNVFHVTKRKISEVLGMDLTTYWSGFYRISPHIQLSYDVILFTEMIQNSAVTSPDEAMNLLNCGIGLYQGHFLSSVDMEWAKKRRSELAVDYAEALATLAKAKEDLNQKQEALGLYLRAASNSHLREDLAINIMQLYHEHHMYQDALEIYERLKHGLKEDLGVLPAPSLQELAEMIKHEWQSTAGTR